MSKRIVERTAIELTHNDDWNEYEWEDGDQILISLYDAEYGIVMHLVGVYIEDFGEFHVPTPEGVFGLDFLDEMYPDAEITAWQPISTSRRIS